MKTLVTALALSFLAIRLHAQNWNVPIGVAGGDLSGLYPNPRVAKMNGAVVPPNLACVGTNSSSQIILGTGCTGGGGGSPAGPTGALQYNNASAFGAVALGTIHTLYHGNASGVGSFGAVDLTLEVTGILPVANGGNGTSSPALTGGTNVTITGSWPFLTINAASTGSVAWGGITGTLSSQTDLQAALNAKQATGNYIVGLTGDLTATGPGTVAATLATVNGNVGTCGDATHVGQVTLNAKGLTTACTPVVITGTSGITQLTGDVTAGPGSGSQAATLAAVGSAGACGDSTHSCQLTFDTKGRETARANVAIAGGGGSVASAITSGLLSGLPGTCAVGDVYFATDQPAGQQLYQCSATNTFTQTLNLGTSGAFAFTAGALDVTALVPLTPNANAFTGSNDYGAGTFLKIPHGAGAPSTGCSAIGDVGKLYARNNGAAAGSTSYVCANTAASTYAWELQTGGTGSGITQATGDATAGPGSGSQPFTVVKVNGIAYSATAAAHSVEVITTANTTATAKVIPDCTDTGGNHLNYTQSGDTFSCGTSGGGGGVTTKWVKAYNTTNQTIPASYAPTVLTFDTSDPGTTDAGMHSTSSNTGRLVATVTGIYTGSCSVQTSTGSTGSTYMTAIKNGSVNIGQFGTGYGGGSIPNGVGYNMPFSAPLTSGDYVECSIASDGGFVTNHGLGLTEFYMYQIH